MDKIIIKEYFDNGNPKKIFKFNNIEFKSKITFLNDDNVIIAKAYGKIFNFDNNTFNYEIYLHKDDGPAYLEWYDDKRLKRIKFYKYGELQSFNFDIDVKYLSKYDCYGKWPAIVKWYESGYPELHEYYKNDRVHNKNGPAIVNYYDYSDYNKKCVIHCQCHPNILNYACNCECNCIQNPPINTTRIARIEFVINGMLTNLEGNSVYTFYYNQNIEYKVKINMSPFYEVYIAKLVWYNKYHNVIIKEFSYNSSLHNLNGPALIKYENGEIVNEEFWIYSYQYDEKKYNYMITKKINCNQISLIENAYLLTYCLSI